jgi:hypothetical protein
VSISQNMTSGKPILMALKRPGPDGHEPEPNTMTFPTRLAMKTVFLVRLAAP